MWMNTQIVALDRRSVTYYTPWFGKGADNALFTLELILSTISGSTFAVSVWTKSSDEEGSAPGSSLGTFSTLATLSSTFYQVKCGGIKDLVRFEIAFTAAAAGEGVIFRFLSPTWFDTAV